MNVKRNDSSVSVGYEINYIELNLRMCFLDLNELTIHLANDFPINLENV